MSRPKLGAQIALFGLLLVISAGLLLAAVYSESNPIMLQQNSASSLHFGTPVNVSNNTADATDPSMRTVGTHVYLAWLNSGGIMFRTSPDGGTSWYPPLNLPAIALASSGAASAPVVSANGTNVYVSWAQNVGSTGSQIMEASSFNYGENFSAPTQITSGDHGYTNPVIASWGSVIAIGYIGSSPASSAGSYVVASPNGGASWNPSLPYSSLHEPWVAVWQNHVYAIADNVVFANSNDSGSTWTVSTLSKNGTESWIAAYGSNVYAVWQSTAGPAQLYVMVSHDYGSTYNIFTLPDEPSNALNPTVGAIGSSVWIAFQTNPGSVASQIYVYTSTNNGTTWSSPVSVSGASGDTGFPFEVASSDGQNVFTAWPQQTSPNTWQVMASYSSSGGASWLPPPGVNVSQNSAGSEASVNSSVASGAIDALGGDCFAVWQQLNEASGSSQIFFSSGVVPSGSSTSVSSSGSTITTTSTTSTLSKSSSSTTVSQSESPSISNSHSVSNGNGGGPLIPVPIILGASIVAVSIAVALGTTALFLKRRS